ncbi:acyl carrier protein [Kitasatospora sp. NPDC048540]|uniref:acyl carrier protein n=1 Tax=unclassified Kitasatospora TaxID=2633591 RepID=UPI0005399AD9|nr:acyl carrier protein [Kitasatospora sp. MBT63]
MDHHLTHEELAALIKSRAGITVDPAAIGHPEATFDEFGVDSLGLLGIVGELENRYGTQIAPGAEMSKTPQQFLDAVNASVKTGA